MRKLTKKKARNRKPNAVRASRKVLPFWIKALFTVGFLYLYGATLPHYGITWDAALGELHLGDRYYHYLTSFDDAHLDMSKNTIPVYQEEGHPDFFSLSTYARQRPQHIWGLGHTLSSITKDIFYVHYGRLDPIEAHHAVLGMLVLLLAFFLYREQELTGGRFAGAVTVVALLSHPRVWAHMHNNLKDIPEMVFFSLGLLALRSAVLKSSFSSYILAAVLCGAAAATKANAVFMAFIFLPWLIYLLGERHFARTKLISAKDLLGLVLVPVVAFITFLICWPYVLDNFPHNLQAHIDFLLQRGGEGPDYWQSRPLTLLFYTTPVWYLVFAIFGLGVALHGAYYRRFRREQLVFLLLWLIVPILRVSLPKARDFDGIRHWIEFMPAMMMFVGFGAQRLRGVIAVGLRKLPGVTSRKFIKVFPGMAAAYFFLPVIFWNINYHPNQIAFFNYFAGGLSGAQEKNLKEATDYWGSSYRQGMQWLNENAEKDAILYVGVAGHIVDFSRELYLRQDIRRRTLSDLAIVLKGIEQNQISAKTPRYVMYITRRGHYKPPLRVVDEQKKPVYQIVVDGAPILKIAALHDPAEL